MFRREIFRSLAATHSCHRNTGKQITRRVLTGHSKGFGYIPSYKVGLEEFHLVIEELKLCHGRFQAYFMSVCGTV